MPVYLADCQLLMSNQLEASKPVTDITKADPGVASVDTHGYLSGDSVVFTMPDGMTLLDTQAVRVANESAGDFELESYDTSSFPDFVAAGASVQKVISWFTMCMTSGIDAPDAEPNRIDITTICDRQIQEAIGLAGASSGSFSIFTEPGNPALDHLANLPSGQIKVFKLIHPNGEEFLFSCEPTFRYGFTGTAGEALTGTINFSARGRKMAYAAP